MKKYLVIITAIILLIASDGSLFAQTAVTCPGCNGNRKVVERCPAGCYNGAVRCGTCNGNRETRERCSSGCSNGYIERSVPKTCTNCNGARSFRENQPVNCTSCRNGQRPVARTITGRDGTQETTTTYVNCDRCRGTVQLDNFINVACRPCGGRGTSGTESVRERCSSGCSNGFITKTCGTCSGNGSFPCSRCQGFANIQVDCRRCRGEGRIFVAD